MDTTFQRAGERVLGINQPYKSHEMGKYRRVHLDRHTPDPDLANIVEAYEADLRGQGLIDFDDLLVLGHQLVAQHGWVLRPIQ